MRDLSLFDLQTLVLAAKWTILLALISFVGGSIGAVVLLLARFSPYRALRVLVGLYVAILQGTPILMQLFLCFFGLSLLGFEISALTAASVALIANSSSFLAEIWRGGILAIPKAQWDGSIALGMSRFHQLVYVIAPQVLRLVLPPTVGYMVQIVKNTALASIIGFIELTKTGAILNNITFSPVTIFGVVAIIYFVICFSLSLSSRILEAKLHAHG